MLVYYFTKRYSRNISGSTFIAQLRKPLKPSYLRLTEVFIMSGIERLHLEDAYEDCPQVSLVIYFIGKQNFTPSLMYRLN